MIIREDLLRAVADVAADDAAATRVHAENDSLYNTPPVLRDLHHAAWCMKWLLEQRRPGGDRGANERKAGKLYAEIDRTGFYRGHADAGQPLADERHLPAAVARSSRSKFAKEATAAGLDGLKGHRSVGGMRASIYNAFPEEGIDALVEFMQEFERKNG